MQNIYETIGINGLHYIYIAIVLLMAGGFVLAARRNRSKDANATLDMLDWFETKGLGLLFHILTALGLLGFVMVGWRIPAENAAYFGGAIDTSKAFPVLPEDLVGRIAQAIGALSLGLVAMRSMRFIVPVLGVAVLALIVLILVNYIFALNIGRA